MFTSPYLDEPIEKIALNTKMPGSLGDKMVAAASGEFEGRSSLHLFSMFGECYHAKEIYAQF